eukprot:74734_1
MSIAKRDKGNDHQPPSNEDEGNEVHDPHRFARTNQAIKWAKGGLADAKLYIYAKTGQIQESLDSPDVAEALQKLDTYKEQIDNLLKNAELWTTSMLQTWNHQKALIDSLNEANNVIHTFKPKQEHTPTLAPLATTDDSLEFADIVQGISKELHLDQQESEQRYGQASALLVVPLRNILNHEIQHAVDIKRKYISHKRQYDNCCTTIAHVKQKIEEIDNPQSVEQESDDHVTTFGKLKIGFGKLMASAQTKQALQVQLEESRQELPQYIKQFEVTKQQLMEAITIVEEKLNIEVVHYVQQFYTFVLKWKSGSIINSVSQEHREQEQKEMEKEKEPEQGQEKKQEKEIVVQEIAIEREDDLDKNEERFVADLQIDSMISNPVELQLDEVSLGSNDNENRNDVAKQSKEDADEVEDDPDQNEIEISENHDIEDFH